MPADHHVTDADMPQLFRAADAASLAAQKQYVNGTRTRLVLIVLAATTGMTSWRVGKGDIDLFALAAVVLFVGALLVEGALWKARPDKTWYDARAVAESAKTLAWKFAVCGDPFPDTGEGKAELVKRLVNRLHVVSEQFRHLELSAVDAKMVTDWMSTQREAPWSDRRRVYLEERLRDQKQWYASKADYNKRRSNQWRFILVALELLGLIGSLVEALVPSAPALTPTVAAVVGAVVAWVETKQHDFNARAYSAAVSDLAKAEAKLEVAESEEDWALEVNDAEDAISREHTLWLASRSQL